jgi:glycosyltransferase involved in cell wall biosynthesis
MKKEIFYWGPFIDDSIATVNAMYNSAIAVNKFSKKYRISIINAVGEWESKKEDEKSIRFFDFKNNVVNKIPKYGFINSRLSYWIIFFKSFFPLKKLLTEKKPEFLVIHLLVSLPMTLFFLFRFKTKLILRISGKPKLNIFRIFIWKLISKKIDKVFCPTDETRLDLIKKNIFSSKKIYLLHDPIINIKKFISFKKDKELDPRFKKNNIILVGRLTKQKNFKLIIDAYKKNENFMKKYQIFIFGDGELEKNLKTKVKNYELENKIIFLGYKKNIYKYMANSKLFILTSLWEDPGFVLIEAAMNNLPILSSNCPHGPKEIIGNDEYGGYLFQSDNLASLSKKLNFFMQDSERNVLKKKKYIKRKIKKYTLFNHSSVLEEYLSNKI